MKKKTRTFGIRIVEPTSKYVKNHSFEFEHDPEDGHFDAFVTVEGEWIEKLDAARWQLDLELDLKKDPKAPVKAAKARILSEAIMAFGQKLYSLHSDYTHRRLRFERGAKHAEQKQPRPAHD